MEPRHEQIARIALTAGARYGLALAGGYAVSALGALTQITDAAFAAYRTDPGMIADMRHRFAQWRRELLAADPR
jgi:hypothetical protein